MKFSFIYAHFLHYFWSVTSGFTFGVLRVVCGAHFRCFRRGSRSHICVECCSVSEPLAAPRGNLALTQLTASTMVDRSQVPFFKSSALPDRVRANSRWVRTLPDLVARAQATLTLSHYCVKLLYRIKWGAFQHSRYCKELVFQAAAMTLQKTFSIMEVTAASLCNSTRHTSSLKEFLMSDKSWNVFGSWKNSTLYYEVFKYSNETFSITKTKTISYWRCMKWTNVEWHIRISTMSQWFSLCCRR